MKKPKDRLLQPLKLKDFNNKRLSVRRKFLISRGCENSKRKSSVKLLSDLVNNESFVSVKITFA